MKKLHGWVLLGLFAVFLALFFLSAWRFYEMTHRLPIERVVSSERILP